MSGQTREACLRAGCDASPSPSTRDVAKGDSRRDGTSTGVSPGTSTEGGGDIVVGDVVSFVNRGKTCVGKVIGADTGLDVLAIDAEQCDSWADVRSRPGPPFVLPASNWRLARSWCTKLVPATALPPALDAETRGLLEEAVGALLAYRDAYQAGTFARAAVTRIRARLSRESGTQKGDK